MKRRGTGVALLTPFLRLLCPSSIFPTAYSKIGRRKQLQ